LAPKALEECKSFKQRATGKIGTVVKSMETEAPGPAAKKKAGISMNMDSFTQVCSRIGYEGDPRKIFTHFDVGGGGSVNSKLLRGMDASGKDDKVVATVVKKHHETRQKRIQQSAVEKAVPPVKQLTEKQDGFLIAGREKRGKKLQLEARKKEFLLFVAKEIGSLARAWRLAFDPENRGEVDVNAFVSGLQRCGYLDVNAKKEDVEKAKELFELFADEETGAVTLQILDPRTTKALYQFRCRVAGRYGGVKEAFLEFDPGGDGTVTAEQFRHMCHEAKTTDNIRRLLEYLDPNDEEEISLDLIDEEAAAQAKEFAQSVQEAREKKMEIDKKKGRLHMKTPPPRVGVVVGPKARKKARERDSGQQGLEELKRRLIREHGTLVRAWQKELQPEDAEEVVTFEAFQGLFQAKGINGEAQAAWDAIERESDSSLTLLEFDPDVDADLHELRARMVERYGTMVNAFDELDEDESYELDQKGFLNLCYECQFRRNERRLFAYLSSEQGQRVRLDAIDGEAVEAVKLKREKDAEAKDPEADGTELATRSSRAGTTAPVAGAGDAARAFREQLQRKFGSMIRAWRMIDWMGKVALTKQEFLKALPAVGYAGNAANLWSSLGVQEGGLVSLRHLDPQVFMLLVGLRNGCEQRGGLEKVFSQSDHFARVEFFALCRKVRMPKPTWARLFEQLDAKGAGSVSWEDVRFLEEQWTWVDEDEDPLDEPTPIRNPSGTRTLPPELPGSPQRVAGSGHLCLSSKPRIITGMKKSNSLPAITPGIRDNWNDRHHIPDTRYNKDTQLLHLMSCVLTKDRDRIKRKVAAKMVEVPTMQWLEENMPRGLEDEEDDEGDEEDSDFG